MLDGENPSIQPASSENPPKRGSFSLFFPPSFEFDSGNVENEASKVGLLWKLFNWAGKQCEGFEHLPQSYEIMAMLLTRVALLGEAESLLRIMEDRGILLGGHDIFGKIVEGYARARELEKSISMYTWLRSRRFVPSELCFEVLLNLLIEKNKTLLAFRVYIDMIENGFGLGIENMPTVESIVKLLCKKRKVKEARNVVRKLVASGIEPSRAILNLVANGYSEKKDFDDLLNFLKERKFAPDVPVCHKILFSQCKYFGSEQAYVFMLELESLGFTPDEMTFGIFISSSSKEGKLKDAFIYLSELLSRCLKPDIHCYNALLSGVFVKGMWKHASEIFHEMLENGPAPDLSTFRVLLAGYCKFRRFNEAKAIVLEMVNHGVVQLSPVEDPLSKAFGILGFKPSMVKVKRDNDAGLSKAEFFDTLGNGFYLDTDIKEYEKTVMGVLEDAMFSDCNSLVSKECNQGNIKAALMVKDKMICRGQNLSLPAYSALIKGLCLSRSYARKAIFLFEEFPELAYQLDQETLNSVVRVISKREVAFKGMRVLAGMLHRSFSIDNETFTVLLLGLCKKGCQKEIRKCWELALTHKWLPCLKDCKALWDCLCQQGMLQEALQLFENMLVASLHSFSDISNIFSEVLSGSGHAHFAVVFLDEVVRQRELLSDSAYSHIVSGLCKEKGFQEAFDVLDAMLEKNIAPCVDVCCQLIPQLCRLHRWEKAVVLKEIVSKKDPASCLSVYYALICGLYRGGMVRQATLQFHQMIASEVSPDSNTLNVMIQVYRADNNSRRVGELLAFMVRNNLSLSISSYRDLLKLMFIQDRVPDALSLKEIVSRETNSMFIVMYNILIFQNFQTGDSSLVTVLLEEMTGKGLVLDEVSYNFLICGYYKCKDASRSVEVLKTMIDKDLRPSNRSLRMVIKHLCIHKNINEALELSRVMESRGWIHGSVVQHAIVVGLLSCGRVQEAESFLRRMEERCLLPFSISYDSLIKKFCQYGRINMAIYLLDIMLKKGNLPSPTCFDYVIQGLGICKALDDALNLHAEMLARGFKPSIKSWDMIIQGLCAEGQTVESERFLDCMVQLGQTPTPKLYQVVIDKYSSENRLDKASALLHKMQKHGYVPDFKTHWSLISNLSKSNKENTENGGFLSKLLSLSGFTRTKNSKVG
ncbi:hypothetical protein IFM89_031370 [Coptis chinensis]|uniref:Pentatricopeptide repeat-containing protein n=1 Tax=Coptis chinensis TaxID=261450 RepID=A0A835MB81_9MAGN|nr:hypothetical protein IFM89_031370 [Coptis chinensis]